MPLDAETKKEIRQAVRQEIESNTEALKDGIREAVKAELGATAEQLAKVLNWLTGKDKPEDGFLYRVIELERWRKRVDWILNAIGIPLLFLIIAGIIYFVANVVTGKITILFH